MSVAADQEGGCQCGAIRFRLPRTPFALYACHCMDCQKQSSSTFGLSMWMETDAVEFTGARPHIYRTCGESGREKVCAFCGACGTRLYHAGGNMRVEASVFGVNADLGPNP
ncbi:MAG: GFA family protein [Rhodobacteraceae bacterium]|nr:GFA family protein [Paracoccaceae bacterium]MCY4139453.1 GFA family protein [Paracoccaceae bacterium]